MVGGRRTRWGEGVATRRSRRTTERTPPSTNVNRRRHDGHHHLRDNGRDGCCCEVGDGGQGRHDQRCNGVRTARGRRHGAIPSHTALGHRAQSGKARSAVSRSAPANSRGQRLGFGRHDGSSFRSHRARSNSRCGHRPLGEWRTNRVCLAVQLRKQTHRDRCLRQNAPILREAGRREGVDRDGSPYRTEALPFVPTADASTIDLEIAAIDGARAQLHAGNTDAALRELDAYDRRVDFGRFAPEALYLRMEAQLQAGQLTLAQSTAREIVRRFPRSAQVRRAAQVLESSNRESTNPVQIP